MKLILTCLAWSLIFMQAYAQPCPTLSGAPSATCGATGTLLTDGVTIELGQEYYFIGGPTTFNGVTINGGTLRNCGSLTLNNVNFNSGDIINEAGGALNYGGSIISLNIGNQRITNYGTLSFNSNYNLNSQSRLFNYGVLNINTDIAFQGADISFFNGPGAAVRMPANNLIVNDDFINFGSVVVNNITFNGAATACMGNGSSLSTNNITSNPLNPFSVPVGSACFAYTGTALLNATLTASPGLIVCKGAVASNPSPADFGAATVISNCSACPPTSPALPLRLVEFVANYNQGNTILSWKTEFEEGIDKFIIEKSAINVNFETIGEVSALNQPGNYRFNILIQENSYFRLKIIEKDGNSSYSRVLLVRVSDSPGVFALTVNPVTTDQASVKIWSNNLQQGELLLYDISGRLIQKVKVQLLKGNNYISIPTASLNNRLYLISYHNEHEALGPVRLLIMR